MAFKALKNVHGQIYVNKDGKIMRVVPPAQTLQLEMLKDAQGNFIADQEGDLCCLTGINAPLDEEQSES